LRKANQAYHTEINDLLLTALAYALQEWQGGSVHAICLEGHGRQPFDSEIDCSRTVGWFTNLYPIRLELKPSLRESLKFIKETLRSVPNKGVGYGALRYGMGGELRDCPSPHQLQLPGATERKRRLVAIDAGLRRNIHVLEQ